MKIRSPQNSMLTTLPLGMVRFPSVSAESNNFPSIARNGARRYLSLASAFLAIAPLLITGSTTARAAGADNFELATHIITPRCQVLGSPLERSVEPLTITARHNQAARRRSNSLTIWQIDISPRSRSPRVIRMRWSRQ
jgi:hypothetical protein